MVSKRFSLSGEGRMVMNKSKKTEFTKINRKYKEPVIQQNRLGEIEYLTFPLLSETGLVNHLFTTRMGGVSKDIYTSMNLSYSRGDDKGAVDENYKRIAGKSSGKKM